MERNKFNKKILLMQNKLTSFIEKYYNVKPLEIKNQRFFDELILEHTFSAAIFEQVTISNFKFKEIDFLSSHFRRCFFENCDFQNITWRKCEFLECTFETCNIRDCDISKVEFDYHTFKDCKFSNVNLEWSDLDNCRFLGTTLSGINFNATIISHLYTEND